LKVFFFRKVNLPFIGKKTASLNFLKINCKNLLLSTNILCLSQDHCTDGFRSKITLKDE